MFTAGLTKAHLSRGEDVADTAGGNPGMNKLARVLQQRIKETMEDGIGDIEPDFGVIGKDGSLTTNMFLFLFPKESITLDGWFLD